MLTRRALSLLALTAPLLAAPDPGLLLHYSFDEPTGTVATDRSGNGLDGTVGANRVLSPSGGALEFDGTAAKIVRVRLPEDKRFGTESWTFSAWLKPLELAIDDRQNQRRLFAFGTFPDAYLVIDLTGAGLISYYFCYRPEGGQTISTGGGGALRLAVGEWVHLALVVDRQARQVTVYINGFSQGSNSLPANFAGDFSLNGELTLGSGWHNYWGHMDEVKIWRRAVSRAEVKAEFGRLKTVFGAVESPEAAAAEKREALMAGFASVSENWAKRDFAAVRTALGAVIAATDVAPNVRGYAHLRLAASHVAENNLPAARAEYLKLAAVADYPAHQRDEARERAVELERLGQGLPARDPEATRTRVKPIDKFAAEVWVAPDGQDTHSGAPDAPVASLTRARDLVRQHRAGGVRGPIGVRIRPGEYRVTEPLALTAEDSGSAAAPVVWRAEEPGRSIFYGGTRLTDFRPVTGRGILARLPAETRAQVVQCDLKALGITDYGQLAVRGFGQPPSPPTLELFVDGRPQTLARWPNEGFVGIRKLIAPGNRAQGQPSVFEYDADRPVRWTKAEDAWLFGYFHFLWADATIKIGRIDLDARTITTAEPYHYGGRGMDTGQGIQYYAFNLLEEIDQPGEWYLDRTTGILYLLPPKPLAGATVEIGLLSTPMVTMDQVTDVRLEGLTFDLARYNGLVLKGCQRCLVAGCTISRMAGNGITIDGGEANGLLGCDIHTIGRRASEVIGGDRATLTPGRHFVENCRIHDFGRIDRTYTPAIQLEGVGHRVAHNLMYDCPSSVMRIEGNDHLIEYNEVHSAVRESDDQGAMELFRNATYRGVVFRYNRFTNCGKTGAEKAVHGQAAIRFDDAISGMLVYSNIFIRSANGNFGAVQMNSGRDNVMDNNLFIDCKQGVSGGWNAGNNVWRMLREGNKPADFFTTPLYLERYPLLATMLDEPAYNHLWRNVFYRCGQVVRGNVARLDLFENGVWDEDPGFVDAARDDYRLKPDSRVFQELAFRPIPTDEIGLYEDTYRASWPVPIEPVPIRDWRTAGGH